MWMYCKSMDTSGDADDQPTVLVVENEPDTAAIYSDLLADDYTVKTATSGAEALELVDEDVAVVLLDRKMPGMSGDEVLRTIRDRGLDCRVVLVTGVEPDLGILDLPFDDYLTKPVSPEVLRSTVSAMCSRNAVDDQIREVVALASKMATLETKLSIEEMEASDAYAETVSRFNELRSRTDMGERHDDVYSEFTTEKIRELFSNGTYEPSVS